MSFKVWFFILILPLSGAYVYFKKPELLDKIPFLQEAVKDPTRKEIWPIEVQNAGLDEKNSIAAADAFFRIESAVGRDAFKMSFKYHNSTDTLMVYLVLKKGISGDDRTKVKNVIFNFKSVNGVAPTFDTAYE